jgi:hypothetical protein
MRVLATIAVLASLSSPIFAAAKSEHRPWTAHVLNRGNCVPGLIKAPSGPFALWLTCEGALGTYLSIGYVGPMGARGADAWTIGDRWWHAPRWGDDVTSCVWNGDGTVLYVATSASHGTPGIFRLDLRKKAMQELTPKGLREDEEWEIFGVEGKGQALKLEHRIRGEIDTVLVYLPTETAR